MPILFLWAWGFSEKATVERVKKEGKRTRKRCSVNVGNASLFTKCLFTIFVPLKPPPPLPTSKVMDFLVNFY